MFKCSNVNNDQKVVLFEDRLNEQFLKILDENNSLKVSEEGKE